MNVAFLIYKRPELTARVFEQIRQARPERLLVVADGPKAGDAGDKEKVERTRKIVEKIDWPCEVLRNYSDVNLGCKKRVASGLDWVFEQVEEAIILEDDCLPDPSFFPFCMELLERYRNDTRIMHISGDNFQNGAKRTPYSYYFSKYPHIWGWATWRRAWKHYDVDMKQWPVFRDSEAFNMLCPNEPERQYWAQVFSDMHDGVIDTWDYAWTFACWVAGGLSIIPENNLVSNIGFGSEGTHTRFASNCLANLPVHSILPIQHPLDICQNIEADLYVFDYAYSQKINLSSMLAETVLNRYWYGKWVRMLPVVGNVWARIRKK